MAKLRLERLNLVYGANGKGGGTHAVRDVDLTVGDGEFCVFLRGALPLVIPGIATATVFNIVQTINEFLLAFVLTQREATTAPIALLNFLTPMGLDWGGISAAASMLVLPVIAFAILVRRHLIRGMSFGQLE